MRASTNRFGRRAVALAMATMAIFALSACGSDDESTSGSATTVGTATARENVVKIGVIAPLDAGLTEFGLGIRNSVDLAVQQANDSNAIPGWTIEVEALDDSSEPEKGLSAAETMAADPEVIGVVGTYNSGVAAEVAPVLEGAGIAMISPGNTNPALSRGDDPATPERQFDNYFRMIATDQQQAPFLARYASTGLQAQTVAVVSETKDVSKGLADDFTAAFTAGGGSVVYSATVPDGTTDFSEQIAAITPLQPDLLFYGGEYEAGGAYWGQAFDAGITAPLMGGDGLKGAFTNSPAGAPPQNIVASTVGAPTAELPGGEKFAADYAAGGYTEPASDFGPYAYDAANLLIAAAADALEGQSTVTAEARGEVIVSVQATEAEGVTGPITFDEFGDTTNKVLTMYRFENGDWVAVLTEKVT
jgi:branched-chain amino acid transport system substrate-binding protein